MEIAILTSYFWHEVKEIQGQDRIIFGGAERYLVELCRLLQAEGHNVVVYQPLQQFVKDDEGRKIKINSGQLEKRYADIPFVLLPDAEGGWRYSTNHYLNMIFNEISIFYDLRIYFATFLCWPHVVRPAISISHGIFWDYPHSILKLYNEAEKKEFFNRQLYGFTAPDICVAVDSNIRKVLMALEPGSEGKISIIYNFVDTEKFKPVPKTWDGIRVLYPRRLTQLRGCNDFIKASKEYPQYEYIAVGQSSSQELDDKAKDWGNTTPNIKFIYREMDKMPEVYQQADISVVPTRASEGLSLSLLESLATGLPVITTPTGGLGDAVIDGYNALIYNPDYEELGDYIDFLAKDENLRKKLGERSRQIAVECFDIKLWRQKWNSLIKALS